MALQHASRAKAAANEGVDLQSSSSDGSSAEVEDHASAMSGHTAAPGGTGIASLPDAGAQSTPVRPAGLNVRHSVACHVAPVSVHINRSDSTLNVTRI